MANYYNNKIINAFLFVVYGFLCIFVASTMRFYFVTVGLENWVKILIISEK